MVTLVLYPKLGGHDRCGDLSDEFSECGIAGAEQVDADPTESDHDLLAVR